MARKRYRFNLGGEWDIEDLSSFSTSIRYAYAYFYWISANPDSIDPAVARKIEKYFWNSHYKGDKFAEELYLSIPDEHSLRISSIYYNSPGWIEFLGYVSALTLLGKCAKTWVEAGDKFMDFIEKVEDFFNERRDLASQRKIALDERHSSDIDTARQHCLSLGNLMGFTPTQVDSIVKLTGNPISGLKLMVALARENRRIADLERAKKLHIPDPKNMSDDSDKKPSPPESA